MSTTVENTTMDTAVTAGGDHIPMRDWPPRALILAAISNRKPRQFVAYPTQVPLRLKNYLDPQSEETLKDRATRQEQAQAHLMEYADKLSAIVGRLPKSDPLAEDMIDGLATELAYCRAAARQLGTENSVTACRIHAELRKRLGSRYPQTFEDENGVIKDYLSVPSDSERPERGRFTETMSCETRRIEGEMFVDLSETSFDPIGGFESYDHLTPSLYELEAMRDMLNGVQSTSSTH